MSLEKKLADTDSIYCVKVTNSNQSSIFISNLGDEELAILFGPNYKSDDEIRLRLDKRNLAFNAVAHAIDGKTWFKRKSNEKWVIDTAWLSARLATLEEAFSDNHEVFVASLNKDDHSTQRLYMKGMTSLSREDGQTTIALRDFLFSGDIIVLSKLDNGDVAFEVKIPDNPITSTIPRQSTPLDDTFSYHDILSAIRTKPFILLAGISGTGKSRMVRELARGCCPRFKSGSITEDHPLYNEQRSGNFEMIQVRPNWHDSTQLMGYESRVSGKAEFVVKPFVKFLAKAWLYEEEGIPFFLCLDEMNLAPVEQYFAEYLSIIETRQTKGGKIVTDPLVTFPNEELLREAFKEIYQGVDHDKAERFIQKFIDEGGIPIPQNFIVMGTVNMDETTFSFSRKVLDRAMSFELNEVDMDGGLEADPDCEYGSIALEAAKCEFTQGYEVYAAAKDDCDKIKAFLVEINKLLDKTPFKIAYRTRNEIMIYCHERTKYGVSLAKALDEATSMKILSRIEGDKRRLVVHDEELAEYNRKGLLESLLDVILKGLKVVRGGDDEYTESDVCSGKLKEMIVQLESGYTSFWTR